MTAHRKDYNYWKTGKGDFVTSYSIFDEYGIDNCFIELLEAKSCDSKDELKQLEGGYIRNLSCVNKRIESRTKKEYNQDNKEKFAGLKKEQYQNNKEYIKEKSRRHYHDNKDYALDRNKKYYEDNKEKKIGTK